MFHVSAVTFLSFAKSEHHVMRLGMTPNGRFRNISIYPNKTFKRPVLEEADGREIVVVSP